MSPAKVKSLPLMILKDMRLLIDSFDELYKLHSDIILKSNDIGDDDILLLVNTENKSFRFQVSKPRLENRKVIYQCNYLPSSETHLNGSTASSDLQTISNWFKRWIELMKELSKYQNLLSEPFLNEYTEEFFAEFEFVEEEDDDNPYETKKQIALYNALDKLETNLKSQEQTEVVQEIIKDTVDLKENIQNISKGATKKKVAKIFAKIKKGGIKLFKDVVDVTYKEIIKAALHSGVDSIGSLLS